MGRDVQVRDGFGATSPEPEWCPAGLFGACISRSPKQNRSNMWQARQKIVLIREVPLHRSEISRYPGRLLPRFAQDIKHFFLVIIRYKECHKN